MQTRLRILWLAMFLLSSAAAHAGDVVGLTSFTSNTPALASEVNGNFDAVKTAVDDNAARVTTLEGANAASRISTLEGVNAASRITALEDINAAARVTALEGVNAASRITALETQNAALTAQVGALLALLQGVTRETVNGQPAVRFTGVNVQVVNGSGFTGGAANGTGNLILGYDEASTSAKFFCSLGEGSTGTPIPSSTSATPPAACTDAGGTWAQSHKSGSHYLIVGAEHNYSRWGGIVVGQQNTSNNIYASVSGGSSNEASGGRASVSGGTNNIAGADWASVSGGQDNTASGGFASVSGGAFNQASGPFSSVLGGNSNTASGSSSSVSGGVSNTASGLRASVSGGSSRSAPAQNNWAAGSLLEPN